MRKNVLLAVAFCCLLPLLSACQAGKNGQSGYNMFYTPEDHVQDLVVQEKFDAAAAVYDQEREWFAANAADPDVQLLLGKLSQAMDARFEALLAEETAKVAGLQWPCPQSDWAGAKESLQGLDDVIFKMEAIKLFTRSEYRPAELDGAKVLLQEKRTAMTKGAAEAFAAYPLATAPDFFAEYPVSVDAASVLSEGKAAWDGAVAKADDKGLLQLSTVYGAVLPDEMKKELGAAYFAKLCTNARKADVPKLLAAYAKVGEAGLTLDAVPGVKIAFLEVTSDTLKKKGVIEFPVAVDLDMPFEASAADLKQGFESKAVKEADIVILFNLAMTRTNRRVDTSNYVKSTYLAGYKEVNNPDWDVLQVELQQANVEYMTASAKEGTTSAGTDLFGALGKVIGDYGLSLKTEEAKKKMEDLKKKVAETPRYNKEPVYEEYPYQRVEVESVKTGSVQYYVIDKRKKRYYSDFFDIRSQEFFTVAYNLQDSDPNLDEIRNTNVTEKDLDQFESQAVRVKLSELLDHYASHKGKSRSYVSMDVIRRDIIKNRNVAVASTKKEDYGFDRRDDKRFESVVVVRNSKGLGSGFYVTTDMVLTNYHVVEEQKFIEMKKWDKTETFGKVVAKDVRLDLALVKVQDRGAPVTFYDQKEVKLGDNVEAIGHPEGVDFTLTRGVISSVREHTSIMGVKGKPVLFIQTDTAINHGNSGGPLFLGRFVIGVNDWGWDPNVAVGLNFSIHYSEVFKFLNDNSVAYRKGH
ncbi:trypsin-like peptidase domain-containing protein [Pseudodesulfovibrio sp.]|uniref:S1C family serine protease n=1 Tax=Pseudodesulfovibrio sp. TaxID=2035812 RepID=UPI002608C491|nr:trypsin-like peptidase domain-containing protein [Pseudodesulfovibrio sp.]MDD3310882.1 trypsin-like peptidase domain-containing protein [Pseudodesulfovibrio sp.]